MRILRDLLEPSVAAEARELGGNLRPVVVVTRGAVLDVRANVTVAEISTSVRGLAVEEREVGTV